jgi:hypothetical protein
MRAVLTVHGVGIFGGRGPWQKPIERVLAPHCHCITIKYSHYRWLGFLSAVVEPWVLVPAIVALYVLKQWYTVHFVWAWFIVALALSCIAARFRHRLTSSAAILSICRQRRQGRVTTSQGYGVCRIMRELDVRVSVFVPTVANPHEGLLVLCRL